MRFTNRNPLSYIPVHQSALVLSQMVNDPIDLRKAARDCDLELMDTLVKRMLRKQINSGATAVEGVAEDIGERLKA